LATRTTNEQQSFRGKRLPLIFVHFGWIMLLPSFFLALSQREPLMGFAALALFGAFSAMTLAVRGVARSITFDDSGIAITRTNRSARIPVDALRVTEVTLRGWWDGLRIRSATNADVTIWRHEFSRADWDKIRAILLTRASVTDSEHDWLGFNS